MTVAARVLLVVGSDLPADSVLLPPLGDLDPAEYLSAGSAEEVAVDLVCRRIPTAPIRGLQEVVVTPQPTTVWDQLGSHAKIAPALRAARLTPLGRLTISFSPFDGGRAMWRAARTSPAARDLADRADLVVAVDNDGVRTAWEWLRRGVVPEAYFGILAASRLLASRART